MATAMISVAKSRVTLPCDVDLDKEAKRTGVLKQKTPLVAEEPAFQRIFVHRGLLLALMAAAYALYFFDNVWTITNEFKTYDSIKRCPDLGQPEFTSMTSGETTEADNVNLNTYYAGWWEQCGATDQGKQYRMYDDDERATSAYCFFSLKKGRTFVLVPLHNIVTAINDPSVTSITEFVAAGLDRVNETHSEQFSVYLRTDPSLSNWYGEHIANASNKVFTEWTTQYTADNTYVPTCPSTNDKKQTALGFSSTYSHYGTNNYEVRCFSDTGTSFFYYWPLPETSSTIGDPIDIDSMIDSLIYATQETHASHPDQKIFSAVNECETYPTLARDCCTSKEVMISARNSPALVRVRKAIAVIKILMNGLSAAAAIYAAVKWTDLVLSRRLAVIAWLAPFVVSSVLAVMPLASMAKLSSTQAYDDTLIKSLDDADIDGVIKYFNLLMPSQTEYIVDTMQYFYEENRHTGREVADLALQIEFRLKTMTATLVPLALTALSLPGAVTKAAVQVKEFFPSVAWLGWLIRLLPMFYLPWASAIFCSMSQIFAGPFVTCAVVCFLTTRVIDLTYNAHSHTNVYSSYQEYRKARRPRLVVSIALKLLLIASVVFLIAALLTDKYLKRLGIKALLGEVTNLGAESAHLIISILIGFIAKSSNTIIMFSDILLLMNVSVANASTSAQDLRLAAALRRVFQGGDVAPATAATATAATTGV